MAPVKKSKAAKTSESINSKLQLVVKSGKVCLALDCSLACTTTYHVPFPTVSTLSVTSRLSRTSVTERVSVSLILIFFARPLSSAFPCGMKGDWSIR